eukprot:521181-Pyramimonas_sp.AAC.1
MRQRTPHSTSKSKYRRPCGLALAPLLLLNNASAAMFGVPGERVVVQRAVQWQWQCVGTAAPVFSLSSRLLVAAAGRRGGAAAPTDSNSLGIGFV